MVGARVRALAAYKDFLTLWKDADDIPILKGAKTEYAKLQSREKSCLVGCCFTDTVVNSDSPSQPRTITSTIGIVSGELAEDLFQETWIRVLERGHQYDGRHEFSTWLYAVARNLTIDYLRKKSPVSLDGLMEDEEHAPLEPADTRPAAWEVVQQHEQAERISTALVGIPAEYMGFLFRSPRLFSGDCGGGARHSFRHPPFPLAAMVPLAILGGTILGCYILLIGYVNRDAGRRGMSRLAWTLLAMFIPNALGIVLYFVLRKPRIATCPQCGNAVQSGFNFCPRCNYKLSPSCPQCQRLVGVNDVYCPYCGTSLRNRAVPPSPTELPG